MDQVGLNFDSVSAIAIPLLSAACLACIFGTLFVVVGKSHSNRKAFARNFILLAMIIAAIIMIIKQSIALSLGLVGALSIVRFRVAIKEPEELTYLFLMIAIGIGMGAGEVVLTIVFSTIAALVILVNHFFARGKSERGIYNVNIISTSAKDSGPSKLTELLDSFASRVSLRRFDENETEVDALYFAEFRSEEALSKWRESLMKFDKKAQISFLDPETVF